MSSQILLAYSRGLFADRQANKSATSFTFAGDPSEPRHYTLSLRR